MCRSMEAPERNVIAGRSSSFRAARILLEMYAPGFSENPSTKRP